MPKWRYKPADNRTPVNDPILGHLEYGTVTENPEAAFRPDFEPVPEKPKRPAASKTSPSAKPPAQSAEAPKTGRSL